MSKRFHILHLEDDATDGELIAATLMREQLDFEIDRVANRQAFEASLNRGGIDVILADNHLPGFDGLAALSLARERAPQTPFIFVSGFMGEEIALESLKNGARDYVFKHNLARLAPAVRRGLEESRELSVRVEAERALRESEATLRSFFDTAPVLMGIVEMLPDDLLFLSYNKAVEEFFGAPGTPRACLASALGLAAPSVESWRSHFRQTKDTGQPVRFEDIHQRSDKPNFLSVTVSVLPPMPGRPPRFCFVAEDITARRQMEQQFLRSQRLESIGTLASGIAHDLNNVLAPITLTLKLFRPKLTDPEDRELLSSVESSVNRGAKIIRQLLTFARGVDGERKVIAWSKLIGDLEQMVHNTFPRSIEIKVAAPKNLWPVMGDATEIYQVLMNLCVNARDAMPAGGSLVVIGENVQLTAEQARLFAEPKIQRAVCLRVRDTGTGIPAAIQSRIFDPFFTTKEVGQGTGLGLPTAMNIVKRHGGFISLDTAEGRGTEFQVWLPAQMQSVEPISATAELSAPPGAGQLILVADDEKTIRSVTHATLLDQGYQVLTAPDGQQALDLFRREAGRVQLVITDLMMPAMDGATLIDRIRELEPAMHFIAISGLLEESANGNASGSSSSGVRILQKPFSAEALLRTIHETLQPSPVAFLPGPRESGGKD